MTAPEESTLASTSTPAVAAATAQLRAQTLPQAAEIADRILRNALRAQRSAPPVRAHAPHNLTHVSTRVISTLLREHIDNHLLGAAVGRIAIRADRYQTLQDVTVELYVQYGTEIAALAEQARHLAREALASTLGTPDLAEGVTVDVTASHIHVSDVTVGDPHLVNPDDQ